LITWKTTTRLKNSLIVSHPSLATWPVEFWSVRRRWGGIKNGELLRLDEDQFDLFIAADRAADQND
jgi:hypothetical protein